MSDIADDARVSLVLADYAAADAVNKVNVIGAGWQVASLQPETGLTPPQSLVVLVDFLPRHYREQFALTVVLLDDVDAPVEVPGPTGEPQALRISQLVKAEEPSFQGTSVPRNMVPSHIQVVINFPGGLPLAPGRLYTWQVDIDGDAKPGWRASFFVAGPPPGPVIG